LVLLLKPLPSFKVVTVSQFKLNKPVLNGAPEFSFAPEPARFKKCKQCFEYQHLLLNGETWWSKF